MWPFLISLEHTLNLTRQEKTCRTKILRWILDIMCEMNTEQKKCTYENGVKVIHLKLLKSLYGCMESELLRYGLYTETLNLLGFIINPSDKHIANNIIDNNKFAIAWYVDDNKVSHVQEKLNTKIIGKKAKQFGELTLLRDTKNKLFGM